MDLRYYFFKNNHYTPFRYDLSQIEKCVIKLIYGKHEAQILAYESFVGKQQARLISALDEIRCLKQKLSGANAYTYENIDVAIHAIKTDASALNSINPYQFEELVARLFLKNGYKSAHTTKKSCDGGIDVILEENRASGKQIAVQCKRRTRKIYASDIITNIKRIDKGVYGKFIYVTSSQFHPNCFLLDTILPIELIDRQKIMEWINNY